MCKWQQLDNSENEETAPEKQQRFNEHNHENGYDLDKNKSKAEGDRYVLIPSPALFSPPQK